MCAAPIGNQFWLMRAKSGRDKIFKTPDNLWSAACEYFQWAEDNPLSEEKLFSYQGVITRDTISKMRAMTLEGLYLFLGINKTTWYDYKEREDYTNVIGNIENVIKGQKFAGAAADLLNANIIARDLGLKDASTNEVSGPKGGPVHLIATDMPAAEATELYRSLLDD